MLTHFGLEETIFSCINYLLNLCFLDIVIRFAVKNFGHYAIEVTWPEIPGNFDSYVISYEPYDEFKPNVRPSPVEIGREFEVRSLDLYGLVAGQEYTIYLQTKTGRDVSQVIQRVTQTTCKQLSINT